MPATTRAGDVVGTAPGTLNGRCGLLEEYDLVTASVEARTLFSKNWMPGFLHDPEVQKMIAVKCKRVVEIHDESLTDAVCNTHTGGHERRNLVTPTTLFAFKDARTETPLCFENARNTASPVRVAVWDHTRSEYVDRGWGMPVRILPEFYVFDISPAVQCKFATNTYPVGRASEAQSRVSHTTKYNGHVYDSITEARHALFFDALQLTYTPHPRCVPTLFGDWTIDFYLDALQCYVEIKPTEPSLEEQMRCINVATTERIPVVLLYGEMCAPFWRIDANRPSSSSAGATNAYARKKPGIQGMRFAWCDAKGLVTCERVVWVERDGSYALTAVDVPALNLSWESASLMRAYEIARTHKFENI